MGNSCREICKDNQSGEEYVNIKTKPPINLLRDDEEQATLKRKDRIQDLFFDQQAKPADKILSHGPDLSLGEYVTAPSLAPEVETILATLAPMTSCVNRQPEQQQPDSQPFQYNGKDYIYKGQWRNGQPHGFGRTYFSDGSVFEGDYIEGVAVGNGRYVNPDGSYFDGEVKAGRANGQGKFVATNYKYTGAFRDNNPHGQGVEQKTNNDEYLFEGTFERGQKSRGTLNWQSGKYVGNFENNKFNGNGTLVQSDGVYTGDFVEGKYNGQGEYVWSNGAKYKGEYQNGLKEGYGRYDSADQTYSYQGNWKGGLQHGAGKVLYKGKAIEGKWQNGRLTVVF